MSNLSLGEKQDILAEILALLAEQDQSLHEPLEPSGQSEYDLRAKRMKDFLPEMDGKFVNCRENVHMGTRRVNGMTRVVRETI